MKLKITRNQRFSVRRASVSSSVNGQSMVSQWSVNGQSMVSQWSANGQPMVSQWSANGQSMISQWSVSLSQSVDNQLVIVCHSKVSLNSYCLDASADTLACYLFFFVNIGQSGSIMVNQSIVSQSVSQISVSQLSVNEHSGQFKSCKLFFLS